MKLLCALALALSALGVAATPAPGPVPRHERDRHILHEKRDAEPIAWKRQGPAAENQHIHLQIGLKQRNLEHSHRFLSDVSHPHSPQYGRHWTAERVANVFAPTAETLDRTVHWLVASGIGEDRLQFGTGRNWINFDATVAEAESLFHTQYYVFEHIDTGSTRLSCDSYSLPKSIKNHIDFVMPTVQLDGLQPIAQAAFSQYNSQGLPTGLTGLENCDKLITIDCLRVIYNFGPGNYSFKGNEIGIAEFSNFVNTSDLRTFFQNFTSPKIPLDTLPEFISIDGGKNLSEYKAGKTLESGLDFQNAYSIIWPQGARRYQIGDSVNVDGAGTFNIFADALDGSYCTYMGGDQPYIDPNYPDTNEGGYLGQLQCGGAPLSNVISVSYGQIEAALPRFYQERQCHEWMKLGLQGVSLLFASGDSGVAANTGVDGSSNVCVNAEYGYLAADGNQFSPSFPANCPYVTAVGATQLKGKRVSDGEVAGAQPVYEFYSGGGFSQFFPRPSYQNYAVGTYLKKYAPDYPDYVYNRTGRGIPDVSALGVNITTITGGQVEPAGGTSASTPIVGSLLTLINEERLRAGKKTIGFVNPVFYQYPDMFNDITEGSNPGCGTDGFPTAPGWDPVTGLGTPNYQRMLERFMSLP